MLFLTFTETTAWRGRARETGGGEEAWEEKDQGEGEKE